MDNPLESLDFELMRKKLQDDLEKRASQLPSLEQYVTDEVSALLDAESSIGENLMKPYDQLWKSMKDDDNLQYSGSMVEGATLARCFQRKKDWREVEIDIMYNLFTIPQDVSHLLEPVEDGLGFVRLPFSKELCPGYYTECDRFH